MNEQIVVNGEKYKIVEFSGKVIDQNALSETHVSGGGGYSNANGARFNPVVSNTYTTKEFFLVNEHGKEKDLSFTNKAIPPTRPGHVVQVKWLIKEDNPTGKYVVVHNHSTNKYFVDEIMIAEVMYGDKRHLGNRMLISSIVSVIGLGFIIYSFVAKTFLGTILFLVLGIVMLFPYINFFRFIKEFKKNTSEMKKELISRMKAI